MPNPDAAALEANLRAVTDSEVRDAWHRAEVESREADLLAGEMERRNLDD